MRHYHALTGAFLRTTRLFPHFNFQFRFNEAVFYGICERYSYGIGLIIFYIRALAHIIEKRCGNKSLIRGSATGHGEFYFFRRNFEDLFSAIIHCYEIKSAYYTEKKLRSIGVAGESSFADDDIRVILLQ